jgi:serine/threonine-protein kinase RsbW
MGTFAPDNSDSAFWEKTFPNQLPALMRAIEEVSGFLAEQKAGPRALYTAQLALEEMGTNIIKYGFDDAEQHSIVLQAHCAGELIELRLTDDGHPFDPSTLPDANPRATLEERAPGGWGISLVRKLVTEMNYSREGGRNVVTLRIQRVN